MTDVIEITNVVPFARGWYVIAEVDVARLEAEHAVRGMLCDQLEACADALPTKLPPEAIARMCQGLMDVAFSRDEGPQAMFRRCDSDPLNSILLDHLRERRLSDASHALDLIAALDPPADAIPIGSEVLGYMLRCYFDNCRYAMDFEMLALLTLSGQRLTCGARAMLIANLAERAEA